jgi:hypothetical protein
MIIRETILYVNNMTFSGISHYELSNPHKKIQPFDAKYTVNAPFAE